MRQGSRDGDRRKFVTEAMDPVELQRRRGDMVENGQKLENGVNVLIKSLIFEISP